MPTYLVTGGAGFIGSHLVESLLARGAAVRVLDNFATGRRENLAGLTGALDILEGDLRDLDAVRRAAAGTAAIFHLGALPSVARSVEDPITSNAVNVGGTTNVILAARDAGVRRIVYASSSSVYGDSATLPKIETMTPAPLSPYAIQKLAGEHYARIAGPLFGVEGVSLRFFNVFGPRQDPKSDYAAVIPRFITALLRGEAPTIFGDGQQSRDFTFVGDVVEACLRAADASGEAAGEAFNIACGERHTLLELFGALAKITGRGDLRPKHAPQRPGDVRHSQASIEKARALLGYAPRTGFAEGLERTVAWYRGRA
jgi:UDP-glucose 4-epimerase